MCIFTLMRKPILSIKKKFDIDKIFIERYNIFSRILTQKEKKMKKLAAEFKKFITRGNVVDMAVGVLIGSSFTAIVNGMSNFILKPLINWILTLVMGDGPLTDIYTMLKTATKIDETTDETVIGLANSIYIDWGSFINAIINFLLIAVILFVIVKIINTLRDGNKDLTEKLRKNKLTKEQRREIKAAGIKRCDRAAVSAYFEEKKRKEEEAAAALAAEEAEKAALAAKLEREANPTSEDLLKEILAELRKSNI